MYLLIWLIIMGVIIVALWRWSKPANRIEDDTSYLFEGRRDGDYGAKFFNILRGRDKA